MILISICTLWSNTILPLSCKKTVYYPITENEKIGLYYTETEENGKRSDEKS